MKPGEGVLASDLYMNSPAYKAGVRPGDVITHLNGENMSSRQVALAYVAALKPGQRVKIRGIRNGKPYEVVAEVTERPHRS
jgi:serine protease DegS